MPTDAQPMPRPTRNGLKVLAVGLLVLAPPVLYVASIGPVGHITKHENWSRVYTPIVWAGEQWEPVDAAITWYMLKCGAWTDGGDGMVYYFPPLRQPHGD
jgi:hypothetical protein